MDLLKNLITPHFSSPLLHTPSPAKRAHQRGLGPLKSHPRSPSVCLSKEPDSTAQPELTRRNSNTGHTSLPPAAVCPNKPHTDHNNYQAVNHVTHLSTKPHNVCTSHPPPHWTSGTARIPTGALRGCQRCRQQHNLLYHSTPLTSIFLYTRPGLDPRHLERTKL